MTIDIANGITVVIEKDKLLSILKKNKQIHLLEFVEAEKSWYKAVTAALEDRLFLASRQASDLDLHFRLPRPQSHVEDYNNIIEMLELHTGNSMTLDSGMFKKYVQDDWSWMRSFKDSTALYVGKV